MDLVKEQQKQMLIGLLEWMNKVAQDNPMALETDSEDIVDMYLQGYYTKTNVAKNDDGSETHIQVYTRELTLDERAKQHQTPNIFYDIHGSFNIVDSIENSDMTIEDREWLHGKFDEAGIPRNIKIQSGGEIGKRGVQVATIGSTRSNRQTRCTGSIPVLTTNNLNKKSMQGKYE